MLKRWEISQIHKEIFRTNWQSGHNFSGNLFRKLLESLLIFIRMGQKVLSEQK